MCQTINNALKIKLNAEKGQIRITIKLNMMCGAQDPAGGARGITRYK